MRLNPVNPLPRASGTSREVKAGQTKIEDVDEQAARPQFDPD
jgi:hypothetical protein